ncbi:eCIS core domain-containing protein [Actinoplanes sp. CA-015351]|uniref:eCIS core domain-containing protein n=1 Tax=Actinoplanes sp. CA-015351 TaxID=3239897 RepID=UPI003D988FF2
MEVAGIGLAEDAQQLAAGIRSQNWVDSAIGGVGVSLEGLSLAVDPLGTVASWGVAWLMEHVRPLQQALDHLAGDADDVTAQAATWANVAALTAAAHQEHADHVRTQTAGWSGAAGDAYRAHATENLAVLDGIAAATGGIASAVEGAGLVVGLVREIVRDLIANFIATLAVRLPQWLAMEGITLGIATPVVAGQVSALVLKWANKIQHFIRGLLGSLRRLKTMIDRLGEVLNNLRTLAGSVARSAPVNRSEAGQFFSKSRVRTNRDVLENGSGTPMTLENIHATAERMGIDLGDVDIVIISDAEEIRYLDYMDAGAYTPSERNGAQIRFGPASFADPDSLAATIAHEHTHVQQQRSGEHLWRVLRDLEDEAYASELPALELYRREQP